MRRDSGRLARGRADAVPVQTEPRFTPGTPEVLFEGAYVAGFRASGRAYNVSPDGQRFLMVKAGTPDESGAPPSIILVQSWFE